MISRPAVLLIIRACKRIEIPVEIAPKRKIFFADFLYPFELCGVIAEAVALGEGVVGVSLDV